MKMTLKLHRDGVGETRTLDLDLSDNDGRRPTVLDALLEAREEIPDLAFRYGCRNQLCGICTVDMDGRPRLACRTPAKTGMTLGPPGGLPVLQDLVARRDGVNQRLAGRLPEPHLTETARRADRVAFEELGRCIECYACLDGCPLHAENDLSPSPASPYEKGDPYTFLRIQRAITHPGATPTDIAEARDVAETLGLETCIGCDGCVCGVGINLMRDVIGPLLAARTSSPDQKE